MVGLSNRREIGGDESLARIVILGGESFGQFGLQFRDPLFGHMSLWNDGPLASTLTGGADCVRERSQWPQAACPTMYQRAITLNGTPSIQATRYRITNLRASFCKW